MNTQGPYSLEKFIRTLRGSLNLMPAEHWYQYEPFRDKDKFIRVLDLHRNTGDQLQCIISQVPYRINGYQALSYQWGSNVALTTITVRDLHCNDLGYIP